ncbi:MAG TPA: 50S ribosomal protein L11 methyltransferase [Gaiellaceae bacterium]|nr:50S ribosomal protein L11 methyltransferase [Gaiellaceae bacterium]
MPVDLVEETIASGGRRIRVARPRRPEDLLDEEAFEHEEFLPYWAELWPSALSLVEALGRRDLHAARVAELGCGLALPSVAAALGGARVLATDWSDDALAAARRNARLNGVYVETLRCSWAEPAALVARAPFDLVLASDVLYERRNAGPLLALLPQLGSEVLLADPGRPALPAFLARAAERWQVTGGSRVHRLRAR